MTDPRNDDVVGPGIRVLASLSREDRDRGATGCLRPAVSRCHHLTEPSGHDGASTFGEQAPDLLGGSFPRRSAPDHRDLTRHGASRPTKPTISAATRSGASQCTTWPTPP